MSVYPTDTGNLVVRPANGEVFEAVIIDRNGEDVVQFYDKAHAMPHQRIGQFVAEYYVETLLAHPVGAGLNLYGGIPEWVIDADTMAQVLAWLRVSSLEEPVSVAVGLPVIVTVYPNGRVSFKVDTTETSEALRDAETESYDDTILDAAAALVDAVWDEHSAYFTYGEA